MKKLLVPVIISMVGLSATGCSLFQPTTESSLTTLSSEQSLATLSYLSGGFLSLESQSSTTVLAAPYGSLLTSSVGGVDESTGEPTTVAGDNIDTISAYLDRFETFIENGTDSLASVSVTVSDNPEYAHMLSFVINEEDYVLYYNTPDGGVNLEGIMIVNDVEYAFTAVNELDDKDELDDDDDDDNDEDEDEDEQEIEQDDEEDLAVQVDTTADESESKMEFVAVNGDDYIEMTYKTETDGEESEVKIEMIKSIAGVVSEVEMKISQEDDEFKVEVQDGSDYIEFKRELDDGEFEFKLEYTLDGVSGEIKAKQVTDELGNVTYQYKIEEDGEIEEIEDEPEHDDDDEDEVETEEETEAPLAAF